jgi:hypothetical protein
LTLNVVAIYWYLVEWGGRLMKKFVNRIIRDEKGHALELVLTLLGLGGLILAPVLGLMSTGLLAGQVYEQKTDELYAADAGVEDAVWKIQQEVEELPTPGCGGEEPEPWSYNITDSVNKINGKNVEVTITYVNNTTYRVDSIASFNGSETQIQAYIAGENYYGDYSGLMDHILTSPGEIDVAEKVVLEYPEGADPYPEYPDAWPEVWEAEEFYGEQVADGMQYDGDTAIDLEGNDCPAGPIYINDEGIDCPSGLEPLYVDGKLDILNSDSTEATLTLNGTIYATGDMSIGATNGDMILDLNGQTIFASSNSTGNKYALTIGGKCTVKGPGVIIAVGDVQFKPKSQAGEEEGGGPVFILSIAGTSYLQPSGHVYGAIAGSVEVYVQQGEEPTIEYPEGGFDDENLNFLSGFVMLVYSMNTWEVVNPA